MSAPLPGSFRAPTPMGTSSWVLFLVGYRSRRVLVSCCTPLQFAGQSVVGFMLLLVLGELVQTTAGKWITQPATRCRTGTPWSRRSAGSASGTNDFQRTGRESRQCRSRIANICLVDWSHPRAIGASVNFDRTGAPLLVSYESPLLASYSGRHADHCSGRRGGRGSLGSSGSGSPNHRDGSCSPYSSCQLHHS